MIQICACLHAHMDTGTYKNKPQGINSGYNRSINDSFSLTWVFYFIFFTTNIVSAM